MVAKVLGTKIHLIKFSQKKQQNKTKQRKEICEEEALEKCTNVVKGKNTHTYTHTHTHPTKGSKQSSSTDSTGAGLLAPKYEATMCSSSSVI